MEFVFVLLLAFFFIILYILPAALVTFAVLWVIYYLSEKYNHSESDDICPVCQDTTDWCTHDP
jgi:hypothetical protein